MPIKVDAFNYFYCHTQGKTKDRFKIMMSSAIRTEIPMPHEDSTFEMTGKEMLEAFIKAAGPSTEPTNPCVTANRDIDVQKQELEKQVQIYKDKIEDTNDMKDDEDYIALRNGWFREFARYQSLLTS